MALEVHSPGLRLIQFTKFNSYLYLYIYTYYLHMFIDVHSQEVIGKISMARLPQLPPEKMIRLKPSRVTWSILNLLGKILGNTRWAPPVLFVGLSCLQPGRGLESYQ